MKHFILTEVIDRAFELWYWEKVIGYAIGAVLLLILLISGFYLLVIHLIDKAKERRRIKKWKQQNQKENSTK